MDDLPECPEVETKLLFYLAKVGQPRSASECYRALAEQFQLSPATRHRSMPNQAELHWHNRVRTAMNNLVKQGYADRPSRDHWVATRKGLKRFRFFESIKGKVKIQF
jgi:restriction endonuclease Mrr